MFNVDLYSVDESSEERSFLPTTLVVASEQLGELLNTKLYKKQSCLGNS